MNIARALLAATILLSGVHVGRAQTNVLAFFLAREDNTLDGQINPLDTIGVFAALGAQNERLTLPDEQVISYQVSAGRDSVAYVSADADGLGLSFVGLSGERTHYPLADTAFAIVERYDAQVWLSGQGLDGQPFIAGVDPATGAQTRAVLDEDDAVVAFSPSGTAALVTSDAAQRVTSYALPALTPTVVPLPPRLLGTPIWSPDGTRFAVVTAADAAGAGLALSIVTSDGQTASLPIPDVTAPTGGFAGWSSTGRYVTLRLTDAEQSLAVTRSLRIADLMQGSVNTYGGVDTAIEAVAWASDDSALLLTVIEGSDEAATVAYQLLDAASGAARPLDTLLLARPTYFTWRPGTTTLWMLGTPFIDDQSAITSLETGSDALSVLLTANGTGLASGALLWNTPGDTLLVLDTVLDPIEQLTGVTYSLNLFDEATNTLTRLTPPTLSPLPFGILPS